MTMQNQNVSRAAMAYRRAAASVPPLTAVVMLYDKAIVALHRAIQAAQARRLDESFARTSEATTILRGLSHALDFAIGGEVAKDLRVTYTRNILALLDSFGKPDMTERYLKLAAGLSELRDAWALIANLPAKSEQSTTPLVPCAPGGGPRRSR